MAEESRYFVDLRSGCVAVRDRTMTDPEYQGLHPETDGVVAFWGGERKYKTCPECGHARSAGWGIPEGRIYEARTLCDKLNAEEIFLNRPHENGKEGLG